MPLFICEKCGTIENTALGHYWPRLMKSFKGTEGEKALCSECTPLTFPDGTKYGNGQWHSHFAKQTLSEYLKDGGKLEYVLNAMTHNS